MLLSIMRRLLVLVALVATTAAAAEARTVQFSGPCPNGNTWIVIVTYDADGNVGDRAGFNCAGNFWRDHCATHPADPVGLPTTSDYLLTTDDGRGWIRFNLDASGNISRMWGRTSSGAHWEADREQPSFR